MPHDIADKDPDAIPGNFRDVEKVSADRLSRTVDMAEADLELRGEGTLMNKEQKGRSDLKLASLRRDRELVELAREAAYEIVDPDITLTKQPELRAELSMFLRPEDEEFLFKS